MDELQKSDIYQDIGNFENLSQLELIKKTQKWKKIYEHGNIRSDVDWINRKHLMKYAKQINPELMFWMDKRMDSEGKLRPHQRTIPEFFKKYLKFYKNILENAIKYYLKVKEDHKEQFKINHSEHQNQDVKCSCGGKYTLKNKAQHFKTKRHQSHLEESENK